MLANTSSRKLIVMTMLVAVVIAAGIRVMAAGKRHGMVAPLDWTREAFATSDMTRPFLTVTAGVDKSSFSTIAASGLVPLAAVHDDDAAIPAGGSSVTVIGRDTHARVLITDSRYEGGFIDTPPELDMGFQTGVKHFYQDAKMAENGYEFLAPKDQEYLVGTAFLTFYSPDGLELGQEPIPVMFNYSPHQRSITPDMEGVIIR